jgi:hypothetical protein
MRGYVVGMSDSPTIDALEPRRLMARPLGVHGVRFDFDTQSTSGLFKGTDAWSVTVDGTRFKMTEGKDVEYGDVHYDLHLGTPRAQLMLTKDGPDGEYTVSVVIDLKHARGTGGTFGVYLDKKNQMSGVFNMSFVRPSGDAQGVVVSKNDFAVTGRVDLARKVPGATVWADVNGNGVYDRREPRTFTDANGKFSLVNIPTGFDRVIRVAPPKGWVVAPGAAYEVRDVSGPSDKISSPLVFSVSNESHIGGLTLWDARRLGAENPDLRRIGVTSVYVDANNNGRRDEGELHTVPYAGRWSLFGVIEVGSAIRVETDFVVHAPKRSAYFITETPISGGNFNFYLSHPA